MAREWLHHFALTVRSTTLAGFTTINSCILTTRLAIETLARLDITARPQPVYVSVHNRLAWSLTQRGVPIAEWPSAAHSLGITENMSLRATGGGWNGHLVLLLRQPGRPRLLIDLTADQFDRPIRNLRVGGPVFMDIPTDAPWTPHDPLFTVMGGPDGDGAIVSYRPMPPGMPEAAAWRTSPDWNEQDKSLNRFTEHVLDNLPPVRYAV